MKTILFTLLLSTFFISNHANAQKTKVKIKDGIAHVDGDPFLKWKKITGVEASISGLESEDEEIVALWLDYPDPTRVSDANPKGLVRWVELYFPTFDLRCEMSSMGRKGLVKAFIDHKIYVDGVLNEENVQKLVKRQGMRFSENRPGGNVNVIINN